MESPPTIVSCVESVLPSLQSLEGALAVDTEFHAEARFLPELMWIQIADARGNCLLIDGQVEACVHKTIEALNQRDLILHAGVHDLQILAQFSPIQPRTVFDTQIAAGLVGLRYPMSLTRLVEATLRKPLPRNEAMSDWSQRPIQPEQLAYACSDVLHLHDIRKTLVQRPRDPRLPDLHTCSQAILTESLKRPEPENLWRDFRAASSLNARGREILRRGCMIRRKIAQSENRRERQVCSDASLVDLAKRQPLTLQALNQPRHVPRKLRGQLGETLVECVQKAMSTSIEECPAALQTEELEPECLFLLSAWGEHGFRSRGLSPRLLLPESVKTRIALEWARGESPQFRQPWRIQAAQKELDELVSGGFRIGSTGLEKG